MSSESLGGMHCGVLMGANVANEVAQGDFCETTIGVPSAPRAAQSLRLMCVQVRDMQYGPVLRLLFQTPTFKVNIIPDVAGPELYAFAHPAPNNNTSFVFCCPD